MACIIGFAVIEKTVGLDSAWPRFVEQNLNNQQTIKKTYKPNPGLSLTYNFLLDQANLTIERRPYRLSVIDICQIDFPTEVEKGYLSKTGLLLLPRRLEVIRMGAIIQRELVSLLFGRCDPLGGALDNPAFFQHGQFTESVSWTQACQHANNFERTSEPHLAFLIRTGGAYLVPDAKQIVWKTLSGLLKPLWTKAQDVNGRPRRLPARMAPPFLLVRRILTVLATLLSIHSSTMSLYLCLR
ncbi:hypothetical protein OIO90_002960 [Microbotryomycetes sp. JL221]|nr:hypothetical protein OIO90_002960 [Microbotryomycetes sp. JL221]